MSKWRHVRSRRRGDLGQRQGKRPWIAEQTTAAIKDEPAQEGKGKTKKRTAAALVDGRDDPDGVPEDEEKPKKSPIEQARAKASSMANKMATASAKLLGVAAVTKRDQLTAPLLGSIADCRKALEQKRTTLLQLATSPKSTFSELKAATLAGAKVIQDGTDDAHLAKPLAKKAIKA